MDKGVGGSFEEEERGDEHAGGVQGARRWHVGLVCEAVQMHWLLRGGFSSTP